MGLLDGTAAENTTQEYTFASGGIDDFVNDFNRPKLDTNLNEWDDLNKLPPETEIDEQAEPLEKLKATSAVANASASLLTIALDTSLSTVLGLYAGDDAENYKADPDQREELEKAIAEYVKLKGGDIPPGVALILIVVSIYGSKGAMAFQFRKVKKQAEAQQKRIAELEKQLELAEKAAKQEPEKPEQTT